MAPRLAGALPADESLIFTGAVLIVADDDAARRVDAVDDATSFFILTLSPSRCRA